MFRELGHPAASPRRKTRLFLALRGLGPASPLPEISRLARTPANLLICRTHLRSPGAESVVVGAVGVAQRAVSAAEVGQVEGAVPVDADVVADERRQSFSVGVKHRIVLVA